MTLWTPSDLTHPGLEGRYDASNLSLTGSNVNSLTDLSGNSRTLSASGAITKATYSSSAFNSGPTVVFADGGGYRVGGMSLSTPHPKFYFAMTKGSGAVHDDCLALLADSTSSADLGADSALVVLAINGGGGLESYYGGQSSISASLTADTPAIVAVRLDGTNHSIWINGTQISSQADKYASVASWATINRLSLGSEYQNETNRRWDGLVAEVIFFDGDDTLTETVDQGTVTIKELFEGYLSHHNGFAGANLPGGHVFKSAAPSIGGGGGGGGFFARPYYDLLIKARRSMIGWRKQPSGLLVPEFGV